VQLRHELHQEAEGGLECYKTKARLLEYLTSLGVESHMVHECAETGMWIEISGKGLPNGPSKTIAFRADLDGLPMEEKSELPFKSRTSHAHMCGHDGHMAMLMGFAEAVMKNLHSIPNNVQVRLIWQPAEEGPGGAQPMIDAGCLKGVDEIYGIHNWFGAPEGAVLANIGP
jgi:amidohydrolase